MQLLNLLGVHLHNLQIRVDQLNFNNGNPTQ